MSLIHTTPERHGKPLDIFFEELRVDESFRQDLDLPLKIRARVLTTIPDSTSQKFLLIGTLHKSEQSMDRRPHAAVFLDFAPLRKKQCTPGQFEKWVARTSKDKECLMGHKVGNTT